MVISTDTDAAWLPMFSNLTSLFHQVLLVPVYQDGGTCGAYPGKRKNVPSPQKLEFAGIINADLFTNEDIRCPRKRSFKRKRQNLVLRFGHQLQKYYPIVLFVVIGLTFVIPKK